MGRIVLIAALMLSFAAVDVAEARNRRKLFGRRRATANRVFRNRTVSGHGRANARSLGGTAQQIAENTASLQARRNRCFHPGNSFGGNSGTYEGVGAAGTRQGAINNCCWKNSAILGEACYQGSNGMWFACRRYQ